MWVKGEVVVRPPDGLDLHSFRDPFVVREGDRWRMFVGGGTRAGEALALTWTSADLETWSMPWTGAPLRVIVDGPVLEISSHRGILGGAVELAVSMPTVEGSCSAWSL